MQAQSLGAKIGFLEPFLLCSTDKSQYTWGFCRGTWSPMSGLFTNMFICGETADKRRLSTKEFHHVVWRFGLCKHLYIVQVTDSASLSCVNLPAITGDSASLSGKYRERKLHRELTKSQGKSDPCERTSENTSGRPRPWRTIGEMDAQECNPCSCSTCNQKNAANRCDRQHFLLPGLSEIRKTMQYSSCSWFLEEKTVFGGTPTEGMFFFWISSNKKDQKLRKKMKCCVLLCVCVWDNLRSAVGY